MTKNSSTRKTHAFNLLFSALLLSGVLGLTSCGGDDAPSEPPAAAPAPLPSTVGSLRLIGQQVLPRRQEFQGTVVGGLSGIDFNATTGQYLMISDDRTTADSPNAPRMYTANISFTADAFSGVQLLSTINMRQPDGTFYEKVPSVAVADPEAIRIDPVTGNYVWVSEGDRALGATPQRVINPFVRELRPDGAHVREYKLPTQFEMSRADVGPRGNLVFEGLTFTPDRARAVVITEGALFQDGPAPSLTAGAMSRIVAFDRATGAVNGQYVYPIDAVQTASVPAGQFTVNGPTEILAVSNTKFLVLERSFSVGVVGNQVRLYEIDISAATNVQNFNELTGVAFVPVTKRLVLNFNTLATQLGGIANLEGMTFGPRLANGRQTLVVVADDNFPAADSATDRNQFLVFEVVP